MNYETMDWLAEAKRIKAAFNLKDDCEFIQDDLSASLSPVGRKNEDLYLRGKYLQNWLELSITYSDKDRVFEISKLRTPSRYYAGSCTIVNIGWDGSVSVVGEGDSYRLIIAQALFHLDLLTPEVETKFRADISAHQRIEWMLEYESRLNRETPQP